MDSNGPKFAGMLLELNEPRLVPKQPQKHYLIDSLSLALRLRSRFYPVFGSNWTQIGPKFFPLKRAHDSVTDAIFRQQPAWPLPGFLNLACGSRGHHGCVD